MMVDVPVELGGPKRAVLSTLSCPELLVKRPFIPKKRNHPQIDEIVHRWRPNGPRTEICLRVVGREYLMTGFSHSTQTDETEKRDHEMDSVQKLCCINFTNSVTRNRTCTKCKTLFPTETLWPESLLCTTSQNTPISPLEI